jgi:SAM-dependent methyltransferase
MGYIQRIKSRLLKIPIVQSWYIRRRNRDMVVNVEESLEPESYTKAKKRWLESKPDTHLTWDLELSGQAFIRKVLEHRKIDFNTNILEVGPGYGRLLNAILELGLDFREYYGVDISPLNINHLREKYNKIGKIHFIEGNIEVVKIGTMFDLMISSLTLKHFFPSLEKALCNVSTHMAKDGIVAFDLKEGNVAYWEEDGTYIRLYSKFQVKKLIKSCNLQLICFDKVTHTEGFTRLLIIARK